MRSHPDWILVALAVYVLFYAIDVINQKAIDTPKIHLNGKPAVVFGIVMLVLMLIAVALEFRTL